MAVVGNLGSLITFEVSSDKVLTFDNMKRTVKGRWAVSYTHLPHQCRSALWMLRRQVHHPCMCHTRSHIRCSLPLTKYRHTNYPTGRLSPSPVQRYKLHPRHLKYRLRSTVPHYLQVQQADFSWTGFPTCCPLIQCQGLHTAASVHPSVQQLAASHQVTAERPSSWSCQAQRSVLHRAVPVSYTHLRDSSGINLLGNLSNASLST